MTAEQEFFTKMAKITSVIDFEKQRGSLLQCRQIHYFSEGSFFHAYEWSAWLFVRYIKPFNVNRKYNQTIKNDYVVIGVPGSKFDDYVPENASVVKDAEDERHIIVTLPEPLVTETDAKKMDADYQAWRMTIPISEQKDKGQTFSHNLSDHPVSITGVMKKLLDFDLNDHSPNETVQFLKDLKRQLTSLI